MVSYHRLYNNYILLIYNVYDYFKLWFNTKKNGCERNLVLGLDLKLFTMII